MTPNTWLTVIAFFFFIAPGLLFDTLAASKKVKRRETTFTEISRVALVSTCCSATAFALVALFGWFCLWMGWHLLPDPAALIKRGSGYFADNLLSVLLSFAAGVVLALAISYAAFKVVYRNSRGNITFESTWRKVMTEERPTSKSAVHAQVGMKDGTVWVGQVSFFSPDMEVADREIVLTQPLRKKPKPLPDGTSLPSKPMPPEFMYTVLKDSEIAYITVAYDDPATEPSDGVSDKNAVVAAAADPNPASLESISTSAVEE